MNKIAAVVVTYNRKELLKKCIQHILEQTVDSLDIVVIDNGSTDGTEKDIHDIYADNEQVIYINTKENLGGAGGFSFGIKWAAKKGYDYLWIMDDDTIPEKNTLEEFLNADKALNGEYGFLSSYAKWIDGTACNMNVPRISNNWRVNIDDEFNYSLMQVESASFVSMFVKTEVVKKVGLPIKEFFIWADDVEYTRRISKQYPCYFVYKSQVVHEMGSNQATSIIESDETRLERYKLLYRNKYYIVRHGAKREKILYWLEIKNTIRDIRRSNCSHKSKRCRIVLGSCIKGLTFKPTIEYLK